MNITEYTIKNNRLTIAIIFVIIVLGLTTFKQMPRDDMPSFLIRVATIVTRLPGASPERMELLVSDKIEKAIQEIPEVDYIQSESRTGISIVTVVLKESEFKLRPIFDNIRRKVDKVQKDLPSGSMLDIDDELGNVFGIIVGLTGEGFDYSELKDVAEDMRDGLIKIPNAAKVEISGIQEERIFIDYNNAKLTELGLTQSQLQNILASTNIIFPGGNIKYGDERIIIEPTGNFESVEDIKKTIISSSGGRLVYLGDVTNVYRDYIKPKNYISKINGISGLAIGISLKAGGNIVELGKQIDEKLEYYKQIYPIGVEIERVASQDTVVNDSVNNFTGNLLQSIVVVLIVMLLFLGFRTGMIVASLIPMVMVLTIVVISAMDVGLNKVSLGSLIIALGMLVDNAIVMSESIMVKMEKGEKGLSAAISSAKELMVPLLVASLTTSAAFLSFFLAKSVMGEIMGQLFIVVTVALLASWLFSLTMIPMLCVYFIKIKKKEHKITKPGLFERFNVYYRRILIYNLKRPYVLNISSILMFIVSLYGFTRLPFIFFPDSERALVAANIEMPLGTSIERTEQVINDIDEYIEDSLVINKNRDEGVISWSSYGGGGAPKYDLGYTPPESEPGSAHILLNTSSGSYNQQVINKLDGFLFRNFPEMSATVSRLAEGGGAADDIAIRITGKDPGELYDIVNVIKTKLNSIRGVKTVKDSWGMKTKKFVVKVNQAKAQLAGVTSQDIATSLKTALAGSVIGEYREDEKTLPIVMRDEYATKSGDEVSKLESFNIYSQMSGRNVPLKQVADIELEWQASKILRRNLYKTITVTANMKEGFTPTEATEIIIPWLEEEQKQWDLGYSYNLGGEAEESSKAMGAVSTNLPLAGFIILLLLIGQFNSIRKSAIVLLTIPLGLIGIVCGLLLTNSYFGFMAFLGLISLAGIVINNAIVLLDRIKIEQTEFKRNLSEAIIVAAQQRFRPILLTTFTTSCGLLPLWFGGGVMWEPMAITIIFGLLFATVITLLFVPVLYKSFFRVSYKDY